MTILESAQALQPHLAELRKDFHAHPEISRHEERTSAQVVKELEEIGGYEIKTHVNGYGVVAELKGARPGKTVALRADMDALQITEETGLPFASENPGVMHACGHDTHITMLLGAARLLAERREEIRGTVRLLFQPAEELSPVGGAKGMIEAGALDGVDAVFGLHVWPDQPVGVFATKGGPLMAASDHFTIRLKGKSCHGAQPHEGVDAVVAGAQLVTAIQSILGRNVDPQKSAVITVGRLQAGTRYNIVAETCELEGTCRTFDADVRDLCEKRMKEVTQGVAAAMGCEAEILYERGYCAVDNDPAMADYMLNTAAELFGEEKSCRVDTPSMCAEDFAFYLTKAKGTFGWLGCGEEGKTAWPLHNCHVAPPDDILWRGSALFTKMVRDMQ